MAEHGLSIWWPVVMCLISSIGGVAVAPFPALDIAFLGSDEHGAKPVMRRDSSRAEAYFNQPGTGSAGGGGGAGGGGSGDGFGGGGAGAGVQVFTPGPTDAPAPAPVTAASTPVPTADPVPDPTPGPVPDPAPAPASEASESESESEESESESTQPVTPEIDEHFTDSAAGACDEHFERITETHSGSIGGDQDPTLEGCAKHCYDEPGCLKFSYGACGLGCRVSKEGANVHASGGGVPTDGQCVENGAESTCRIYEITFYHSTHTQHDCEYFYEEKHSADTVAKCAHECKLDADCERFSAGTCGASGSFECRISKCSGNPSSTGVDSCPDDKQCLTRHGAADGCDVYKLQRW